jgi:hypothetical protein
MQKKLSSKQVSKLMKQLFLGDTKQLDNGNIRVELNNFWAQFPGGNPGYVENETDPLAPLCKKAQQLCSNWVFSWRTGGNFIVASSLDFGVIQVEASDL